MQKIKLDSVAEGSLSHPPSWVRSAIFYQIFPDRFAKSDLLKKPVNIEPWDTPPTLFGYKGGDLYGVIEQLDYLQDLGVTAMYFTPVFSSTANHRYHTHDYYHVDWILGGNEAFRSLLHAAHSRGMKVILDGVFNHASRGFYQFNHTLENGKFSPFLDWFHFNHHWLESGEPINAYAIQHGRHKNAAHETSLVAFGYQAWWDIPALPKFNTNNPEVREYLFNVAEYWTKFGIDGWRLDVPMEINDDSFWQEFRRRVRAINPEAYIVGEIWEDAERWLRGDQFDGVMNYLFSRAAIGFFLAQHLNHHELQKCGYRDIRAIGAHEFADKLGALMTMYPKAATYSQMNLLGSHDTPRILTAGSGDVAGIRMAFLCLMTIPGAPCIYYGDEVGMPGNHDPDCRRTFSWDSLTWDRDLREFIKSCTSIRRKNPVFTEGDFKIIHHSEDLVAYSRASDKSEAIVLFNVSSSEKQVTLPLRLLDGATTKTVMNLMTKTSFSVEKNEIKVTISARSGQVLLA